MLGASTVRPPSERGKEPAQRRKEDNVEPELRGISRRVIRGLKQALAKGDAGSLLGEKAPQRQASEQQEPYCLEHNQEEALRGESIGMLAHVCWHLTPELSRDA